MKSLIVQTIDKVSVGLAIVVLLIGLIAGYSYAGIGTAIVGLVIAFVFVVFFFGILFVQLEMNENLRAIRQELGKPQA